MRLVSACLAGIDCRYDGTSKPNERIIRLVREGKAIPVCPEQLGGLPTPRLPAEQRGERVIAKDGSDLTAAFVKGAQEGLKVARLFGCIEATLKSKSPSCGCGKVFDGTFTGRLVDGDGVFAKLLKQDRITVTTAD